MFSFQACFAVFCAQNFTEEFTFTAKTRPRSSGQGSGDSWFGRPKDGRMGRSGERKCSQVLTTVQGRHSGEVSGAESRLPPAEAGTPSDADRQPAVRSGQTKGAGGLSGQTRSDGAE